LISLSALLLGFKYGSPEAIQEFVVRESRRNPHC
jgi:DNA-binding NarL/FixJ family response regulator